MISKQYAVVRTYADGTGGWGQQWTVTGTRTTDYPAAVQRAARLDVAPRNMILGWRFYAARIS